MQCSLTEHVEHCSEGIVNVLLGRDSDEWMCAPRG